MDDYTSFGAWLKQRRRVLDLTQAELAKRVGCAMMTIQKIEADERRPSKDIAARLAEALELPPAEHTAFIKAARAELAVDRLSTSPARARPLAPPPWRPAAQPLNNLSVPPTPLIGREREVAAVTALLRRADVRLLTLTGVGGTGKTRLALQVATELLADFPDGVWFVDLAPITDPVLVASTIAQTFGLQELSGQPVVESLTTFLRDRQLLLVLDNFEQVVAAASLVAELLSAAPRLKALVTSRTVLHLYGEQEYPVPPLDLPDLTRLPSLEALTQYAAVALFIQHACAVKPDFQVTNANAPAVAHICARVDGLPLAIELAAARVKLFPPQALLGRLEQRLKLLTGGARDLPARQQTLRGAIDWSYHLLTPDEQALFARLGVFVGGWTVEAAAAVCPGAGDDPGAVLDGLASLVDKSLVRQTEGADGEARFAMLETIREYALERLAARGEAAALRERHARYYLARLEALPAQYPHEQRGTLKNHMLADMSNLAATVQWIMEEGDVELAVRWNDAAMLYGSIMSLAYVWQAWNRWYQALMDRRETIPVHARAKALSRIGLFAYYQGEFSQATALLEEALALTRTLDDPHALITVLNHLADAYRDQDLYARAAPLYEEGLALAQALGDEQGIASAYHCLGELALLQEDYARALALEQASLALFRVLDVDWGITVALIDAGFAAQHQGDNKLAAQFLDEGLSVARTNLMPEFILGCLVGFAALAAIKSRPKRAARLLGATDALQEGSGTPLIHVYRREYERTIAPVRARLATVAWEAAWAEGRAMTLEQAIAYALEVVQAA